MSRPDIIKAMEAAGNEVDLKRLSVALKNRGVFDLIAEPGHHRTGKYRVRRDGRKLAPRTRNKYLIAFGMFYKLAIKQKLIACNPFEDIVPARADDHADIIWLTREERDRVTAVAEGTRVKAGIWIALYAGLREGEVANLRWDDVDLKRRWIHVTKSKTGKPRRVPISPALLSELPSCSNHRGRVMAHWDETEYNKGASVDLNAIRKALPDLKDKIKWNIFRHTFASDLPRY